MRLPIFNRHQRAELSAYLDGELIPLRVEAMQAHLASCQSCRAELESLRLLQADLAALPDVPAPRSFALTPQMAARPVRERPRAAIPPRAVALANGMRLAGAAMTVALALVLVLDFTGGGKSNSDNSVAAGQVQSLATSQDSNKSFNSSSGQAPAPAADTDALLLTPTPTSAPGATLESGVGATPPSAGENSGGTSGYNASSPASPPALIGSPGAVAASGSAPTPDVVQTDDTTHKDLSVTPEPLATGVPAALNLPPASGSATGAPRASDSGGGLDTLLVVALALAAGAVLAVAGSVLLPRIGRKDL